MDTGLKIYFICWVCAVAAAFITMIWNRNDCVFFKKSYWIFLFEPWKVLTFLLATAIITIAAPYSNDPTWDTQDSILISVLTYTFIPWSMAVIYRRIKYKTFKNQFFAALILFFVPCWAYDFYILLRDGKYPIMWCENLYLSGGIVFLAGLFWNLTWQENKGVIFAFTLDEWPPVQKTLFGKIAWMCILIGFPVLLSIGWFVYMYFWD